MSSQIASSWSTDRLLITDSTGDQIERLQEIYAACAYIGDWCGIESDVEGDEMSQELAHMNLPPDGDSALHRVQTVSRKDDDIIIGYLILYHGFSSSDCFWIASLAIHPDYQGEKYGREVIEQLTEEVRSLGGFVSLGGSVGVRNIPAVRFWLSCGFTRIEQFDCDEDVYSDTCSADLWLMRDL